MKRLVAVVVAGALSSSLLADPASAGPRALALVKTFRLQGDETVTGLVAPARRSAFVFAMRERGTALEPLAFRWNGRAWSRSPLPGGVRGIPGQADASSAKNVWMTVMGNEGMLSRYLDGLPSDDCSTERGPSPAASRADASPSKVLRWDGRRWTVARTFKNAYINEVLTFGPRDVRVYGLDREGPASWHFDGGKWRRQPLPFHVLSAEAASRRDIWALVRDRTSNGTRLVRFDGTRWAAAQPDAPSAGASRTAADRTSMILDFGLLDRGQVWVSALTREGDACSADAVSTHAQLHWNGGSWTRETPRSARGHYLSDYASDGAGGLYVHGWGPDRAGEDRHRLFHRSARGTWSHRTLTGARSVQQITRIPGTRSLWAVGTREDADGLNVAVWSLGRP